MGSPTKTTKIRRKNRKARSGKKNKLERAKSPTPAFPIDPSKSGEPANGDSPAGS